MAALDQLTGLVGVIDAVQGKKQKGTTTTSGTQTTQTQVSDQGVQQIVQSILSGAGGVKSIGGAARSSGLYNSTTEDMLLGDLYARAANQAELARSPTVTSTNQTQKSTLQTGGMDLGTLGTVIGGGMLANQLFKAGGGLLGGGGATAAGGGTGGIGSVISSLFGGGGGATGLGATGSSIGGLASTIGPESVKMLSGAGGAAAPAASGALGGLGSVGSLALPLGGAFLGGLLGGKDAATEPLSLAASAGLGALALGPMGLLAGPLASVAGGFFGDASVICTALHRKGLISKELHAAGHKYLTTLDPIVRLGYYVWAEKIADRINKGSKLWKTVTFLPTYCYLKLISSDQGWMDYVENPLGSLVKLVGEPLCGMIGKSHIAKKLMGV